MKNFIHARLLAGLRGLMHPLRGLDDFDRKPELAPFQTFLAQSKFGQWIGSEPDGIDT